ncbi:YceK/YidQ family lipoprotein [Methylobacter sp. YRD-M1]|uniref:YceK/YidQ family lipoprotein n=1 Tax=Methylobacter sp. YRD-M1 TaxID=2911520 RepID=UPI00227B3538|nr:YceK/YidQ family lipoprotein [Methylobacter sp. YRD-M1]WAK03094.1 YceK/YidQ family lipoprotein [Methylobacter sp. YRD-M1]
MKSNIGRWAVVVLLSIDLFGCSSIRARNEIPNRAWTVYPGPRKAVGEMGDIFSSRRSEPDWIKGLITAILVVDLPITTVFDTVVVPYDVYRIYNPEDFEKARESSESPADRTAESQAAE